MIANNIRLRILELYNTNIPVYSDAYKILERIEKDCKKGKIDFDKYNFKSIDIRLTNKKMQNIIEYALNKDINISKKNKKNK